MRDLQIGHMDLEHVPVEVGPGLEPFKRVQTPDQGRSPIGRRCHEAVDLGLEGGQLVLDGELGGKDIQTAFRVGQPP